MAKINEVNKAIEKTIPSNFTSKSHRKLDLLFQDCNIILDFDADYLKNLEATDVLTLIEKLNLPKIVSEKEDIHLLIKEDSIVPYKK